jgi:hypothetical protein
MEGMAQKLSLDAAEIPDRNSGIAFFQQMLVAQTHQAYLLPVHGIHLLFFCILP